MSVGSPKKIKWQINLAPAVAKLANYVGHRGGKLIWPHRS